MKDKINIVLKWGVDNIYNAVMSGSIKTFDNVLKITEIMSRLSAKPEREDVKPESEQVSISLPEGV